MQKIKYFLIMGFMVLFMTYIFWTESKPDYQTDSEALVISMIDAGKYDLDITGQKFGLGHLITDETNDAYLICADGSYLDSGYSFEEYESQIGLHGWLFYIGAKFMPNPVGAFSLVCAFLLAVVLVWICYELNKRYGTLMAICFYLTSLFSPWIIDFAPNLYWVEFTWFIPMLLGLICVNNMNKRAWIYPFIYLAVLIKCACGYEYITVIMLSSIMFLAAEWILSLKQNREQSKVCFKTIIMVGVSAMLAFITAILIHGFLRGDGNVFQGIAEIYENDICRRTFGNAADFEGITAESLNASIGDVLYLYLLEGRTAKMALALLVLGIFICIYRGVKHDIILSTDMVLFIVSFITCISWFILGKSHSHVHIHMNYVMWFMSYIQIGIYMVIKFVLQRLFECNLEKELQ